MTTALRPRLLVQSQKARYLIDEVSHEAFLAHLSAAITAEELLGVGLTVPELDTANRFVFTAEFSGQLGSLGPYRFKPMVRVEQGHRYRVCITPETGATLVTPLGKLP